MFLIDFIYCIMEKSRFLTILLSMCTRSCQAESSFLDFLTKIRHFVTFVGRYISHDRFKRSHLQIRLEWLKIYWKFTNPQLKSDMFNLKEENDSHQVSMQNFSCSHVHRLVSGSFFERQVRSEVIPIFCGIIFCPPPP